MTYQEALKKIIEITEGKCFLFHGTLLGCVREGKMIDGDEDLDIGILAEDWKDKFLTKIKKEFDVSVGYWKDNNIIDKKNWGKISKIKIHKPNVCIDIWTKGIDDNRYFHSIDGNFLLKTPDKFLQEFKTANFLGSEVRIPKKSEEYLAWNYGDWKTPDLNWDITKGSYYTSERKAVIMSASRDKECWNNYLGIPRQLVEINGEVLIKRTIRQLKERGFDVSITLPEKNFLGDLGIKEIVSKPDGDPIEKILNLKNETPCLAIYGDVYYTDKAMDTITNSNEPMMFFGRELAGTIKRCGEPFAIRVNEYLMTKAQELKDKGLYSIQGGKRRCGEWELYRYINNIPLGRHKIKNYWTEINDLTDDVDTPDNYKAFQDYFKRHIDSSSLSHIIITRMWYEKKEDLLKRIETYKANLLPVLLNQTEQNFDIGILCNKKHEKIIKSIHPRIIPFFTKKKPGKVGKCWHIFSEWKDISGIKKYDIQTNIDSDDIISLDAIKIIKDSITERKSTHIHFFPTLRDFYTGELRKVRIKYRDTQNSAFYSLYQPDKKNYIYIGQGSHTNFAKYAEKTILIPEGHYFVNIHDSNDSSTMESLSDNTITQAKSITITQTSNPFPKPNSVPTINFNIMAHPKRKELVAELVKKLGDIKVIWDTDNNCWHTRVKCLIDHINSGKEFGITIQDDTIVADDFIRKASNFIGGVGDKNAIYNFYYKRQLDKNEIDRAIVAGRNYIKKSNFYNELCLAIPTKIIQDMIDWCEKKNPTLDWVMQRYVMQHRIPVYFSVPSLANHLNLESLIKKVNAPNRTCWYMDGDEWVVRTKSSRVFKKSNMRYGKRN